MSTAKVIVLSVVHQGLSKAEAARPYGVSWQWIHTRVRRYEQGGLDAVEPRSRRPRSNSRSTPDLIHTRILELRRALDAAGLDSGPVTIATHLERDHLPTPSTSTIRRILHPGQDRTLPPDPEEVAPPPTWAANLRPPPSTSSKTSSTGSSRRLPRVTAGLHRASRL